MRDEHNVIPIADGQYLTIYEGNAEFVKAADVPTKVENLGLTLDEFKKKFSETANQNGSELNLDATQIQSGAVQDVFVKKFSPQLIIQGAIDKASGRVKEVWILAQPQNDEELTHALTTYRLLAMSLDSTLTEQDSAELLVNMNSLKKFAELNQIGGATVHGKIRYTAILLPEGVIQLIASAKDL